MLNISQVKRLVPIYSVKELEQLGFEADDFTKGLLDNGFDVLCDPRTGDIVSMYQGRS